MKYTLSAQKLFRRELLVRHGMRFDETLRTGEDALFTLEAYLRADGVSVVADYDCYYLVGREDGKHVTKSGGYEPRFASARALMELIARHVPPGRKRDLLMLRPFVVTLLPQFGPVLLRQSEEVLRRKMALAAPLMAAYWTPGVARRLKTAERLRLTCVALGRPDVLRDVVAFLQAGAAPARVRRWGLRYEAYPHFRDRAAGIPDSAYRLRGSVPLRALPRRAAGRVARRLGLRGPPRGGPCGHGPVEGPGAGASETRAAPRVLRGAGGAAVRRRPRGGPEQGAPAVRAAADGPGRADGSGWCCLRRRRAASGPPSAGLGPPAAAPCARRRGARGSPGRLGRTGLSPSQATRAPHGSTRHEQRRFGQVRGAVGPLGGTGRCSGHVHRAAEPRGGGLVRKTCVRSPRGVVGHRDTGWRSWRGHVDSSRTRQ